MKYVRSITPCCHVVDVAIMVAHLCIVYNQRLHPAEGAHTGAETGL
jgi:hypothetical protein